MNKIEMIIVAAAYLIFCPCNIYAYDLEIDGIYYNLNVENKTLSVTRKYYYEGYIKIPDEVEYNTQRLKVVSIETRAFQDCLNLRSVTIGNNVETIGREAFHNSGIQTVVIGDGVKTIGMEAFSNCKSLKKIDMGKNVESISALAFANSPLFEEITIPASCKEVRIEAFKRCKGLKKVIIEDSSKELYFETSFYIDENIFSLCENLEYVYQGRNTKRNENNVKCFMFGHGTIKNVVIGPLVTKVDDFINCTSIEVVRSLIQSPQIIAMFSSTTYASAKLIVPIGTKELYKASDDWSKFFNIVEEDMSDIKENFDQILIKKGSEGIYIKGARVGEKVEVFNSGGIKLFTGYVESSNMLINKLHNYNGIIIVKIGNRKYKIM